MGKRYSNLDDIFDLARNKENEEPSHDIAICSECDWRGSVTECKTDTEGDWESGYYDVHLCPNCVDGGCIDDYDMTPARVEEWAKWQQNNK